MDDYTRIYGLWNVRINFDSGIRYWLNHATNIFHDRRVEGTARMRLRTGLWRPLLTSSNDKLIEILFEVTFCGGSSYHNYRWCKCISPENFESSFITDTV